MRENLGSHAALISKFQIKIPIEVTRPVEYVRRSIYLHSAESSKTNTLAGLCHSILGIFDLKFWEDNDIVITYLRFTS